MDVAVAMAVSVVVAVAVAMDVALPLLPLHCLPSKYCAVSSLMFAPLGTVDPGAPKASSDTAPSNEKDGRR